MPLKKSSRHCCYSHQSTFNKYASALTVPEYRSLFYTGFEWRSLTESNLPLDAQQQKHYFYVPAEYCNICFKFRWQWGGLRPSVLGEDRSQTKTSVLVLVLHTVVLVLVLQVWCCVVKHGLVTLVVIIILKDTITFQVLFLVYLFCAWNITTVKINSAFVCFQWSWSWCCYLTYFGLGLKNLLLSTSLSVCSCLDDSCLERFSGCAAFDTGIGRQILGAVSEVFDVFYDRRVVMAHAGNQYRLVFSHGHSANAGYSAALIRTTPMLHLHLQYYTRKVSPPENARRFLLFN